MVRVRVRVRLGYTMAVCLVLQHQVSPTKRYDNVDSTRMYS